MCCSMPSVTPGRKAALVLSRHFLLLASFCTASAIPNERHFGAYYRIQRLTLHLATFQVGLLSCHLRNRVSKRTLSIVRWVPSCSIASRVSGQLDTGWLTRPFPKGFPPFCLRAISSRLPLNLPTNQNSVAVCHEMRLKPRPIANNAPTTRASSAAYK